MKETVELLKRHFDIAIETPDGIKKLRELILTLAMQGKLVTQDPNDQPASELLKEIEAEKKKLIAEGKIKNDKPLPEINPDEVPYEVPKGWMWVRLGNISNVIRGLTYAKSQASNEFFQDSIELLRANNINGIINFSETLYVPEKLVKQIQYLQKGDVLIAMSSGSPHLVGKAAQFFHDKRCTFGAFCSVIRSYSLNLFKYLAKYCETPLYRRQTKKEGKGIGIQNLNMEALENLLLPLPPLPEQKRIVAKIDQLMALCDKLEAERNERNHKRFTVHTASMNRLLSAKEKSKFASSWQFIRKNFNELYSVTENVDELKKAILQLAVMGKLVPQDPNDQPASELLKEIEAEKKKLIDEGKIKAGKPLPEIKPDEVPYQVPAGWVWCRLGGISQILGGFAYKSNDFETEGSNQVLRLGNIRPNTLRLYENPVFINDALAKDTQDYCLRQDDIVITMTGTRAKRDYLYTVRIEENPTKGRTLFLNQRLGIIRLFWGSTFMNMTLKDERLKDIIFFTATGTANQANIGMTALNEWLVPLPPLVEQKLIVAKVDQLMKLCDELTQQIQAGAEKKGDILDAVLARA